MALAYYYNQNASPPEQTYVVDKNWLSVYGGVDPDTMSPEQLAAAGFYLYTFPENPQFDPIIYTVESEFVVTGTNATTEYTVVALPLSNSKATYTETVKSKAYSILQPTDWLVVRKVENGTEIPEDWNAWRESIRTESQTKIAAIDACTTSDELVAYVTSEEYKYWPPNCC